MDLRQLRYFTKLAEVQNFHRAAEQLNISQPPLSVAIRRLEDELGVQLFDRDQRGARLTAAGLAALQPARDALAAAELVREAVRLGSVGEIGRLTIGFVGSAISERIPLIIPRFRARFPKVELVLQEMTSVDISQSLDDRRLDVGLLRLPMMSRARLDIEVIETDVLSVALPAQHLLARRKTINLAELSAMPFIINSPVSVLHTVVFMACQKAGFRPAVAQEATQLQTVLSLVQSGLGVALVPARMGRFAPEGVKLLHLADPVATEMGIACRDDAGPPARNFITTALEIGDTDRISN